MLFMWNSKYKKKLIIIFATLIVLGLGYLVYTKLAPQTTVLKDYPVNEKLIVDSIRLFMDEPNIQFSNQGLHNPSNFTIGKTEALDTNGSTRIVTPPEWERKVYVLNQTNVTSKCQFYSYEVDAQSGKVVQVQMIGGLAVGSDSEIQKAECEKANSHQQITATEAEDLAWAIARKNVPDLTGSNGDVSFDQGDRYIWTWQDKSYTLPEGLTSEPWQYPIIRIILDKQGRLMTYLNTTFFYTKNQ